ncbi:uncharacterized protein [Macrobrachium rosenbergii]|uniref:uncharacterized protein isoform X1 n=1 Tax=Macrobrachium rosenbergii TaxID=79674 RepID=UPI0034D48CBB
MESSQLNLSTCHNWLGNIDFDVMRKTYLEEEEEEEEDTNGAFQVENPERAEGDSTFNWWEEDCEVWSQNFDPTGSNLPADADGSQLPEYISTRIPSHVGNGSSDTLDLKPPYLLDMDKYQSIWETGDAFGHCGAALGSSTLNAPYPTRESLDGTWAPCDPLDPDPSADQDCFGDSALEEILHHLGEGSEETPYDVAEDDQLESAGPTYTVDSHQIPASDVLVKMKASRKHRVRGPKNWEFLMRLLVDPRTNPALIEWEDEGQGIFRLRNPKTIAQIWASRNGNSGDLSYNNFARGLRHHYKKGILIPIPERQLVYQCGQKALEFLSQIKCSQVPA